MIKLKDIINEDVTFKANRQVGDIRFRVVSDSDSLRYVLIPKNTRELDKMNSFKSEFDYSNLEIQQLLAASVTKGILKFEPDTDYDGAGYAIKLIKPVIG